MDIDAIDYFMAKGKVEREHVRGDKTPDGILAVNPVLHYEEITGEKTTVLRWFEKGKDIQRDFPLLVSPSLLPIPEAANVWFIGSALELNANTKMDGYHVRSCSDRLNEDTILVYGEILKLRFLFEVICLVESSELIIPETYVRN